VDQAMQQSVNWPVNIPTAMTVIFILWVSATGSREWTAIVMKKDDAVAPDRHFTGNND
jgi:hypothetical protein